MKDGDGGKLASLHARGTETEASSRLYTQGSGRQAAGAIPQGWPDE